MKTSLRRLRGFTMHRQSGADHHRRDLQSLSQLNELHASQDLEDMKNCYDSLLAAAAATTNTVFEFSESLGDYGSCLLEKTSLNDDEESGKVLLKLGKLQFELQKGLDSYRSHLSRTIGIPSESLLNELRTVEEMKQLCDDKRNMYESMLAKQKEKGRKTGKGERFSIQQLQEAREHYEVAATLFIFRLKSLKQGQSRSLLTQAARHHAAQMNLFKKALKAIEAVEPYVKFVAEQYHIDYQLNELEDDDSYVIDDDDDDNDDSDDMNDDGELSFEYGQNDLGSTIWHPMELDQVDLTFPKIAASDTFKKNSNRRISGESFPSSGNIKSYTQSAPLFADKKPDHLSGLLMRQTSTRKLETYVLPTPGDPKTTSISPKKVTPLPAVSNPNSHKLWHSSPLGVKKHTETIDKKTSPTPLPPPRGAESLLFSQFDPFIISSSKKIKRQAFSGPLVNKRQSNPQISTERLNLYSGPLLRNPLSSPPKLSRASFPPPTSSPKINELHELPRPPLSVPKRPLQFVGYSGPLVSKGGRDPSSRNNESTTPSPLPRPPPPEGLPRSSSIPASGCSMLIPQHEKTLKDSRNPEKLDEEDEVMSPPLRPMSFSNVRIIPAD